MIKDDTLYETPVRRLDQNSHKRQREGEKLIEKGMERGMRIRNRCTERQERYPERQENEWTSVGAGNLSEVSVGVLSQGVLQW